METLETLRRDIEGLRDERDALLGYFLGLFKTTAALIQTYPDHANFHLALTRLQELEEQGRIRPLATGQEKFHEQQVIVSMLGLNPSNPAAAVRAFLEKVRKP